MRPTERSLAEQMQLDEVELAKRKQLFGITEAEGRHLSSAGLLIRDELDAIVGRFYERMTAIDEVALLIGDRDTMDRLRRNLREYLEELFSGFYDDHYVTTRLRIGLTHKRVGVEPKYYFAAVLVLKDILREALTRRCTDARVLPATLDALEKLLIFDTELVVHTYIDRMLAEIKTVKAHSAREWRAVEQRIAERTRDLTELSRTDPLTGLLNQRAFHADLRQEIARSRRRRSALSLVFFDLDSFKQVNDTQGHLRGDDVLRAVGHECRTVTRDTDLASRMGGDEFAIALAATDLGGAKRLAARLSERVQTATGLTISYGTVQTGPELYQGLHELIGVVDQRMYEMKARRSQQQASEGPPPGERAPQEPSGERLFLVPPQPSDPGKEKSKSEAS